MKNKYTIKFEEVKKKFFSWRAFDLIVAFIFVVVAAACVNNYRYELSAEYFKKAEFFYNGGAYDLEKAEYFYKRALSFDYKHPGAHYQLARVYFVQGKYDIARQEIDKSLKYNPEYKRAYYVRGLIDGYDEAYQAAIEDFKIFVAWAPKEWAGYNDLAWVYYETKEYEKAKETAEEGLRIAPNNAWLLNGLGISLLGVGEYNKAEEILEKARQVAQTMSIDDWKKAYPGNDPSLSQQSFGKFIDQVNNNNQLAIARVSDGAVYMDACGSSYYYCSGTTCVDLGEVHLGDEGQTCVSPYPCGEGGTCCDNYVYPTEGVCGVDTCRQDETVNIELKGLCSAYSGNAGSFTVATNTFATSYTNSVSLNTDEYTAGANKSISVNAPVIANNTYTGTGWFGDCMDIKLSNLESCTIYLNYTCTLKRLSVVKDGNGTGSVNTVAPDTGISCGSDCFNDYSLNEEITLSAAPDSNSNFTGWSGGGCSGTGNCIVTMDAAKTVTATFNLKSYTLNVTKNGTGVGNVNSSDTKISCGSDCSDIYPYGSSVTLTASENPGSTFGGWGGDCISFGTNPSCTLNNITANKNVTATFNAVGANNERIIIQAVDTTTANPISGYNAAITYYINGTPQNTSFGDGVINIAGNFTSAVAPAFSLVSYTASTPISVSGRDYVLSSVNPHNCNLSDGGTCTLTVSYTPIFVCTSGDNITNATICSLDNSNLPYPPGDVANDLVASCSIPNGSSPKCQYTCNAPFVFRTGPDRCIIDNQETIIINAYDITTGVPTLIAGYNDTDYYLDQNSNQYSFTFANGTKTITGDMATPMQIYYPADTISSSIDVLGQTYFLATSVVDLMCELNNDGSCTINAGYVKNTYSCTPGTDDFSNSSMCFGDDADLSSNLASNLVDGCTATKCEYTCNSSFVYNAGPPDCCVTAQCFPGDDPCDQAANCGATNITQPYVCKKSTCGGGWVNTADSDCNSGAGCSGDVHSCPACEGIQYQEVTP